MYEIFDSIMVGNDLSLEVYLLCMLTALICGAVTALTAAVRSRASRSFLVTLTLLPMIVTTVIMMVNGSIGTGLAVMGAFSLIRFRSVPGKAKDIAAIFLSMTSGLCCATGHVAIALLFTVIVGAVMALLSLLPVGEDRHMVLRITIPESLEYAAAFDDLFGKYTRRHRLMQAKTTNMGSLYKLTYEVAMKDRKQSQAFMDELRCRNGNLEIALGEMPENGEIM